MGNISLEYLGYILDPFQRQAVAAIEEGASLIVAAPTGCGKTLIAEYAVEISIRKGLRVIYTAPIKALSNQKFRDFRRRFGEDAVGIHTGDVTINPAGRLLIMTTEIFRNLILEHSPRLADVYYAIFDEIHYLDDPERGTVWEESIILAPPSIRLLCLSATVPNIGELASWMEKVRQTTVRVIEENRRPVPLRHFLYAEREGVISMAQLRRRFRKNAAERQKLSRRSRHSAAAVRFCLAQRQLPLLYFCYNRRACERYAALYARLCSLSSSEYHRSRDMVDDLVHRYRITDYDRLGFMRRLWHSGCAFHHAGILPAVKEIVERLFTEGLIKMLFCTSTFALGINMPARAVIFDTLEKFDGVDFTYLMTREYNQMAGRAGRRGMDKEGYVYAQVIPGATDPRQVERILRGENERIASRFQASYATILNLYSQYGADMFVIMRKSFRNFRSGEFAFTSSYRREEEQIHRRIAFLQSAGFLDGTALTEKGKLAAAVNGYEIQAAELYYSRSFDECNAAQLSVVLGGLVTEEGKNRRSSRPAEKRLRFEAEQVIGRLRRQELRHQIASPIREMDLSLAAPIFAWAQGCSLRELLSFGVPEGDMIRVLRMIVQLLRTLRDRIPDPVISDRMDEAIELINRDVVDAQAELEVC